MLVTFMVSTPRLYAQTGVPKTETSGSAALSAEDMAAYQKQATQLVTFMEFAFNTIGSNQTEYKDKDIIINQSYLKFFKDSKVQIEDDLAEKRDVVINKDVQAYLKDIDFFFNEVTFKFIIEEITQELNEKGEVFFKVRTSRNLKGITLDGKAVNENKPRFVEINLDEAKRELKIVSIYTTKGGEEQELMSWWNNLDTGWRNFFAAKTVVGDSIPFSDVSAFGRDYILRLNGGISSGDSTFTSDTVRMNTSSLLSEIRRILRTEKIDISGVKGIYDLEPLAALTSLKQLNTAGLGITALDPVRNLSKLETLILAGCNLSSLEPLHYTSGLRYLDISDTYVNNLKPIENFDQLEFLNISGLAVSDLSPLAGLGQLHELRLNGVSATVLTDIGGLVKLEALEISGTAILDLSPVSQLAKLTRIKLEKTYITDLTPLAGLSSLQYIYLDNSTVGDILPLSGLPSLKVIYCDKTLVDRAGVFAFLQKRPEVVVIYESEELNAWWAMLPPEWKTVFGKSVELGPNPEKEQLHEVTYLKKIDISGNKAIKSLLPLKTLSGLEILLASQTAVTEIVPLKDLVNLQVLNLESVKVTDIAALSLLKGLRELNLSGTQVADLSPVSGLRDLRTLSIDRCPLLSAEPLLQLNRLEILYADGVPAMLPVVGKMWDSIPDALIVYQTEQLKTWWNGLTDSWKAAFKQLEPMNAEPDRLQLHRIAALRTINLSESRDIFDISPLRMLVRLQSIDISRLPVTEIMALSSSARIMEFNCSNTPVEDLTPLSKNVRLKLLTCSNTQVSKLDVLESFPELTMLDISGTQVTKLNALEACRKLEQLDCYNTRISSIKALEDLANLKLLRIYNTRVSSRNIEKFKSANPGIEVVFY